MSYQAATSDPPPALALPDARGTAERLYFPSLEAFRGWAILLVALFHVKGQLYGGIVLAPADCWLWTPAYVGSTGVILFFVLSGFLLSLPFLIGFQNATTPSIASFYVARVLRIIPLYYLAVLIAWLDTHDTASSLKSLLFVPVGFAMHPHSLPWWSLCAEVQFYLVLPAAMLLLADRRGRWLVATALLVWVAIHFGFPRVDWWMTSLETTIRHSNLVEHASGFVAGMAAAWLYAHDRYFGIVRRFSAAIGTVAVVALGMLLYWLARTGFAEADMRVPHWHMLEAALWATLVLASLQCRSRAAILWDNLLTRGLGRISYGVFLFHLPVIFVLLMPWASRPGKGGPVVFDAELAWRLIAATGLILAVAWSLHRYVEVPCQRLRRRLSGRAPRNR